MNKIKKVFNAILGGIAAIGTVTMALAWVVTFVCITYGLAIWSFQWFMGLI